MTREVEQFERHYLWIAAIKDQKSRLTLRL
jgi:hypothetical protein